jgi:hypothetical protein
MTDEDIIKRLENMTLPDMKSADHRSALRVSLLKEYPSLRTEGEQSGMLQRLSISVSQILRLNPRIVMVSVLLVFMVVIVLVLQFTGVFSGVSGVLDKASAAMERVESYRIVTDSYIKSIYTDNELIKTSHREIEYAGTSKYRVVMRGDIYNTEIIIIENQVYIIGKAVLLPMIQEITENLPSKEQTLENLDYLVDIEELQEEIIDSELCLHYSGILDIKKSLEMTRPMYIERLKSSWGWVEGEEWADDGEYEEMIEEGWESFAREFSKYEYSYEFWVGKDDYIIRQLKMVRREASDPLEENDEWITSTRYFDFNKEIKIYPPLTESGELEEGWYELKMENFGVLK